MSFELPKKGEPTPERIFDKLIKRDDIGHNAPPQMDHLGAAQFAAGLLERSATEEDAKVGGDPSEAAMFRYVARYLRRYYVPSQAMTKAEADDNG